jgi:putative addiction module component (TIGR02574 family)
MWFALVDSSGYLLENTMPTLVEELSARARTLSPEDRGRLVEDLLISLQDDPGDQVDLAWEREVGHRVEQIKAGVAKLYTSEDVHAQARQIYK